jgi:segregation and condensation protein B
MSLSADSLDRAVEALVFAAEAPPTAGELARACESVSGAAVTVAEIDAAVDRLNAAYHEGARAFRIYRWGQGYRMATVDEVAPYVRALLAQEEEQRLSRALLETLAVIAYKQPTSKPEIDHVRGVNCDYSIRQLLEREFITVVGRSEGVGRPLLYGTTEAFLDRFGLGTLEELPRPREVDELLADPAFSRERALLRTELAAPPSPDGGGGDAEDAPMAEPSAEEVHGHG